MMFFLLHAFFSTGLAYSLSCVFGALSLPIALFSLVVGSWLGRRGARQLRVIFPDLAFFKFDAGTSGVIEVVLATVVLYASVRHFAWMFFKLDSKWMTLHPNNFGDLPLHINYIREIASGAHFPPVNPSFVFEPLRYPFGPDLYSSLWEIVGVPLSSHLFVVGLLSAAVSMTVLRWFGGWWAVGAFFFSGGLIGWGILTGIPVPMEMTASVEWKNLFLSVFITQRGVLFALPASLLLLESLRRWIKGEVFIRKSALTTLGLVWGLLPLFHAHAFVIVSLTLGLFALSANGWRGLKKFLSSRVAVVAYLPAIYFVLRTTDAGSKSSVIHFDPWWTSTFEDAPSFLLQNFGPWLLLPLALLVAILTTEKAKEKKREHLVELGLYSALFVLFYNVMLATWSWDNIKLLIFPYLGFARLAWVVLDPLLPEFAKYGVAFVLFLSGFVAIDRSYAPPTQRGLAIYETADLGQMEGALTEVPLDAVFAAAPTHNHALTYFGRVRAIGYEGHLWSHGIDYKARMAKFDSLMRGAWNGSDPAILARELKITHVVWGAAEDTFYKTKPDWPATFKNVSRVPGLAILEVPK